MRAGPLRALLGTPARQCLTAPRYRKSPSRLVLRCALGLAPPPRHPPPAPLSRPPPAAQRANDETKDWAIPAKGGEGDDADPFLERELKKKERTLKNKVKHLKNMERAERSKGGSKGGLKPRASSAAEAMAAFAAAGTPAGIPKSILASEGDVSGVHGQGRQKRPRPAGDSKDEKVKRVKAAQAATASMGRFDRRLPGEPEPPRDPVRHKKRAATPAGAGEHSRDMAVLSAVVHGTGTSKAKRGKAAGRGASGSREFRRDRVRK